VKAGTGRLPAVALAALVLGLLVCPFLFIAMGALFRFPPLLSLVALPPLLLGSGFLLRRYLARPTEAAARGAALLVVEGLSWAVVGVFLFLVSGINIMTRFERLGTVCTSFLAASAVSLPLVLVRRTALERRLARLPGAVAAVASALILLAAGLVMIAFLRAPPAFIGSHRRAPVAAATDRALRRRAGQLSSGTISIAPQGHSAAHRPQPLQKS